MSNKFEDERGNQGSPENHEEEIRQLHEGFQGEGISLFEVGQGDFNSFQGLRLDFINHHGADDPFVEPSTFPEFDNDPNSRNVKFRVKRVKEGEVVGRIVIDPGESIAKLPWVEVQLTPEAAKFSAGFNYDSTKVLIGPIELPKDPSAAARLDQNHINMIRFAYRVLTRYTNEVFVPRNKKESGNNPTN